MRRPLLYVAFPVALLSCRDNSGDKRQETISGNANIFQERWTLYSRQDTIFHVKRLISGDTGLILLKYDINTSQPEAATQTFFGSRKYLTAEEASKEKTQSANYNWIPFKTTPTLFVQIEPAAFKDELEALSKRQDIEQKIEKALQSRRLGKWTAGDLGPGGANMLYEVNDVDKAISIILETLATNGYDKNILVGRRVDVAEDDWFYEVVYPINYNGTFLTM